VDQQQRRAVTDGAIGERRVHECQSLSLVLDLIGYGVR
jgi:hypothetical protein